MQITEVSQAKDKRLQVAVGILVNNGKLLIQKRRAGTDCAGQWEFPGGKLEAEEAPEVALVRECREELNIHIINPAFLVLHKHSYAHAQVSLHTYMINQWQGEPEGFEGQELAWVRPDVVRQYDLLAGAYPLLDCAIKALDKVQ